jgi:hypothetical protein
MTTITTITVQPDGSWTHNVADDNNAHAMLDFLQNQVGGYIEAVSGHLPEPWTAFVNEEGKLDGLDENPIAESWMRAHGCGLMLADFIVGPVVFIGPPDDEGYDTTLPAAVAASLLTFLQQTP